MIRSSMLKFGQKCVWVLSTLLDEHPRPLCENAAATWHMKMIFSVSAYISGIATPAMERTGDRGAALI